MISMAQTTNNYITINHENEYLLKLLDKGIDDMESGRELPLEIAFDMITKLRNTENPCEETLSKQPIAQYECHEQNNG